MTVQWVAGVVPEVVGTELVVLSRSHSIVHRFPERFIAVAASITLGQAVDPDSPEIHALEQAGLISRTPQSSVSRRRLVAGGASVIASAAMVSLAMPTVALASSQRFTVPDDVFVWFGAGSSTYLGSNSDLTPIGVFQVGQEWTLTVRRINTFTARATVQDQAGTLTLLFELEVAPPEASALFEGQLLGPNGEQSFPFLISPNLT